MPCTEGRRHDFARPVYATMQRQGPIEASDIDSPRPARYRVAEWRDSQMRNVWRTWQVHGLRPETLEDSGTRGPWEKTRSAGGRTYICRHCWLEIKVTSTRFNPSVPFRVLTRLTQKERKALALRPLVFNLDPAATVSPGWIEQAPEDIDKRGRKLHWSGRGCSGSLCPVKSIRRDLLESASVVTMRHVTEGVA